ncbi:hypothetical protein SUGI_0350260 [Cryptomeria japonica]|nr:hypothetical protein SUGI_0350260 [Cryptomeria japonica]
MGLTGLPWPSSAVKQNGKHVPSKESPMPHKARSLLFFPVIDNPVVRTKIVKSSLLFKHRLQKSCFRAHSNFHLGENETEILQCCSKMWKLGLKWIPCYSLEDTMGSISCDQNVEEMHQDYYMLFTLSLLSRVSDLLKWQHHHTKHLSFSWMEETSNFSPL